MKKLNYSDELSEIAKVISIVRKLYHNKSITGMYIDSKCVQNFINVLVETEIVISEEILASKRERVIDYYFNNDIFDDPYTYGINESDLNNGGKVSRAIVEYHKLYIPENVIERFEILGLEE